VTDGSCGFAGEVFYTGDALALATLAIGDVSGDGRADVIAAGNGTVRVWRTLPDAGLDAPEDTAFLGTAAAVAVGQFGGDGAEDVVVVTGSPQNSTQLLVNLGNGSFDSAIPGPGRPFVQGAVSGDFDQDGRDDLLLATDNLQNGELYLLLNRSGPSPFSGQYLIDATGRRAGLASQDLDGDGVLDAVATDPLVGKLNLYRGSPDGGFSLVGSADAGLGPAAVALGNVNGDAGVDAVVTLPGSHALSLVEGTDAGPLGALSEVATGGRPVGLALGDWSRDGFPDVVSAETGPDALAGYTVDPTTGQLALAGALVPSQSPRAVALADLDQDGVPDIVALLDGGVAVYRAVCP
jgi:hypothetical protein